MKKIFLGLVFLVGMSGNLYAQDAANVDVQDTTDVAIQDSVNVETQDSADVQTQEAGTAEVQDDTKVEPQEDPTVNTPSSTGAYTRRRSGGVDWDEFEAKVWAQMQAKGTTEAEFHQAIAYSYITKKFGNQMDRATAHFKKAVELDPSLYLSWYTLGLQFIETDESRQYLQNAIDAKPDYPPPYYWLAYVYCKARRDAEAISLLERYLQIAQGDFHEARRILTAEKVIAELRSGVDGEILKAWRAEASPAQAVGQILPSTQ